MLEHHADAERPRGLGCVERHRPALPQDLALGGLQEAVEHLDEGRLAGAVLAEQGVVFAGPDVEVDLLVRLDGPEAFGQAADGDQRRRQANRG